MDFKQLSPYFAILGIQPTRDKVLIKKAYRKMALKYHPDVNSSPEANQSFILINEAYEILMNGDQPKMSRSSSVKPKTEEEILAEKMKAAKEQYEKLKRKERQQELHYYLKNFSGVRWRFFKVMAYFLVALNLLITFDYFATQHHETILSEEFIPNYWEHEIIMRHDLDRFPIHDYEFWEIGYPPVQGNISLLFDDLKSISYIVGGTKDFIPGTHSYKMRKYASFEKYSLRTVYSKFSIYGFFPFLNLILFIPFFVVYFKRPSFWFNILRLISVYILFPVGVIIILSGGRIFHLLQIL